MKDKWFKILCAVLALALVSAAVSFGFSTSRMRTDLEARELRISELTNEHALKDASIAELNEEKAAAEALAADTRAALTETGLQLEAANATIGELSAENALKDASIAELNEAKAAAEALAADTQAALTETGLQLEAANATIGELTAAIEPLKGSGDSAADSGDTITLETIAALNGCPVDALNVTYDSEGRITFIGNPFSEEKILSENDAGEMLGRIADLLSIENVALTFYNRSTSPTTGYSYYSFYQTEEIEVQPGVTVLFDNKSACVKLIADTDGSTVGLASCIGNRAPDKAYTAEQLVPSETAERFIQERLVKYDPEAKVYPEYTDWVYLYDEAAIELSGLESKRMPAWLIVSDLQLLPDMPATAFLVSMVRIDKEAYAMLEMEPDDPDIAVAQMIPMSGTDAAAIEEIMDRYTSLIYFDGLEDAGTVTYAISEADWVNNAGTDYEMKTGLITVPILYDPAAKEYVLGDLASHMLVADYHSYYIVRNPVPNVLVTETPDDLSSWHFRNPVIQDRDGSDITLFLNPSYAVSTYRTLLDVSQHYANLLGVRSYDGLGMPQLLLINLHDTRKYPKTPNGFMFNAINIGSLNDFAVMATSPALSVARDEMVIGHEYAHGIDAYNSALIYLNVTGAVEEAFADTLGMSLYNAVHGTNITDLGSLNPFGTMRSISDPEAYTQPRYYKGKNYTPTVATDDMSILMTMDMGGVHTNSGVTNYLTYSLSPANTAIEGTSLDWEDLLKLFYEASFCRTADYDYDELGAYLSFGAKAIGLSGAKQSTLGYYLKKLGFCADKALIELLVSGQGLPSMTVRADISEADESVIGVTGMSASGMTAASFWGMLDETPTRLFISNEELKLSFFEIYTNYQGKTAPLSTLLSDTANLSDDILITVKTVVSERGATYDFGENVSFFCIDGTIVPVEDDPHKLTFPYAVECIVGGECSSEGVTLYHVITGTPEEIAADSVLIQEAFEADWDAFMAAEDGSDDPEDAEENVPETVSDSGTVAGAAPMDEISGNAA